MNKTRLLLTRLVSIVALAFFAVGNMWAEETVYKTLTFSSATNSKGTSAYNVTWSATIDGFKWDIANFNNNNNGWNFVRCGSRNAASVGTITTNTDIDKAVTKVVVTIDAITASSVNSIKLYTSATNDFSSPLEAIELKKAEGEQTAAIANPAENLYYKLEFDCKESTSNGIITVSKVEYFTAGAPVAVEAPVFNIESAEYAEPQSVTISAEEGATVYYTIDGTNPDENSTAYSEAITVSETTTIKAIAYKDGEASSVASLTITIIPAVADIAAFKAAGTKAMLTLKDAVVTAVASNGNTYIQDATGGICLYKNVPAYTVGQVLNGTVVGTYVDYSGLPELSNGNYDNVTDTEGSAPVAKEINIDKITEADYCTLVTIKNAHCTSLAANAEISQDDNDGTVKLYTTFMKAADFPAYQNFDVTGILGIYNGSVQILPRSAADFSENGGVKETILAFGQDSYSFYTNEVGTITATVNSGATITYTSSDENILVIDSKTGEILAGDKTGTVTVTASVEAYDGYPAAEATVTVTVSEAPTFVMLVAQTQDGKYYAMSSEAGSAKNSLDAVEVRVKGGKVVVENINNNLLWRIDEANGYIMSYDGKYLKGTSGSTDLSTDKAKTKWTYNETNGYWHIGTRTFIYRASQNGFKNYVNGNVNTEGYAKSYTVAMPWETFTPESETITISAAGYATLYYSEKNLVVPEGVVATTYAVLDNELLESKDYKTGEEIPAGEAVVLKGEQGDYIFVEVLTTTNGKDADNMLKGSDVNAMTEGGSMYYKLSLNSAGELSSVGFYWGAEDGAAFTNPAHKAYLALPAAASVRSFFTFNDIETGVASIKAADEKQAVYSISGVRVQGTPKAGLYIVNGKKVMVK